MRPCTLEPVPISTRCGRCPTCRYADADDAVRRGFTREAYLAFAGVLSDGYTCWRAWHVEMRRRARQPRYVYFNKYGRQPTQYGRPVRPAGNVHLSAGWMD